MSIGDVSRMVAALPSASRDALRALDGEIESRARTGQFEWLGALGAEIALQWDMRPGSASGILGSVLERIVRSLTSNPNEESLRTLLHISQISGSDDQAQDRAERRLASLIAQGFAVHQVESVVFAPGAEYVDVRQEFCACLLQELVLKAVAVQEVPAMRSFHESLVRLGHPLASLPLSLLPEEHGLRRPPGSSSDWTWTIPPMSFISPDESEIFATSAKRERASHFDIAEFGVPRSAEMIGAAVRHWQSQSNGKVAAQEFWSPNPVEAAEIREAFEVLPIIPWLDVTREASPVRLFSSTPDIIFRTLFGASVRGPAYGPGLYGAYGRLAAWNSLRGLAGARDDAPIESVSELTRQTNWFRVDTTADWFYAILWDLAIVALRPGGQEIATLAATDTD